jgi:Ca-activated chloride channel family protein
MSNALLLNIEFWGYQFHAPQWMWALLVIPVLLFLRYWQLEKSSGVFKFSRPSSDLKEIAFSPIKYLILAIYVTMGAGAASLILAMALPFQPYSEDTAEEFGQGIDIMIAMDVSGSMMATDFLPNRLEAAKEVAKEFIDGRSQDRIGFVVFEGEAYTACPATRNYGYLKRSVDQIQSGRIEPGTAIGTGLGTAVARLRSDSLKSKVIILLTDGESNKGDISPMAAAELAKNKEITVYTIGVGKEGFASMPVNTPFGKIVQNTQVNIDEDLLTDIAEMTKGKYFRAKDKSSLRDIYKKIDQMEKTKIVDNSIKREPPYRPEQFLIWGILLLTLGLTAEQLLLKKNG